MTYVHLVGLALPPLGAAGLSIYAITEWLSQRKRRP